MPLEKLELNHAGLQELLNSQEVYSDLWKRGTRVLQRAKDTAPVVSGDYKDHLRLTEAHTDRATVRVAGYAKHTLVVEAAYGTLAKSLDAGRGE